MFRKRFFRRKRIFPKKRTFRRRFRRTLRTGAYTKRLFKLRRVVNINTLGSEPNWTQFNDNPSLSQDWAPVSELFQLYRVNGIKLTWIPTFNVNQIGNQQTSIIVPMYYVHDTNMTITQIPSENTMLQYENLKIRNLAKMHTVYYKMARRINATAPGTLSTDGYSSVQSPQVTQQISLLVPNLSTVANTLGRMVVTAYVSAKVRK